MKVSVQDTVSWVPRTITITLENKDEAQALWCAMNASRNTLSSMAEAQGWKKITSSASNAIAVLWAALDGIVPRQGQ